MCDAVCSNTSEVHLARWFAAAMLAAAAAADARSQPCLPSHAVLDATLPLVPLPSHPRRQVCPGAAACKDCGQLPDQPRAVSVRQCVGGHVHGMIDVGQLAWRCKPGVHCPWASGASQPPPAGTPALHTRALIRPACLGALLCLCSPRDDIADAKERAAAEEAANKEAQKAAMARVTAESAKVRGCARLACAWSPAVRKWS